MKQQFNALTGAKVFSNDFTAVDIWRALHQNAQSLERAVFHGISQKDCNIFDDKDNHLYGLLSSLESSRWHSLCTAAGMTVYGAVALSWCEGAELSQVWEGWEASGFPLKPLPEYERPARFINPALLPQTNSLDALLDVESENELAFCAMLSALQEPLEFDMPVETMKKSPVQISAFLKSHMLKKATRTEEENDLIAHWSEKIEGSEWDVWEDS